MTTRPKHDREKAPDSARSVACPPVPEGCGAPAGRTCTSHGGTRERATFHLTRTAAWVQARIDRCPPAALITEVAQQRRGMHGKDAMKLLLEHGHDAEAAVIQNALHDRRGLMSAKQAAMLLVSISEETGLFRNRPEKDTVDGSQPPAGESTPAVAADGA
ncbi:hypothetical protein ACFZC3_15320 [Streptomyces sp. NPDC007903]|uniref:hypothetical protein n=1 Tax=Streptomyces sp. NPDC007903 TaxID=3364786 RepID=UPI0036E7F205